MDKDVKQLGGAGVLFRYDTVSKALMAVYPDYNWEVYRFNTLNVPWDKLLQGVNKKMAGKN